MFETAIALPQAQQDASGALRALTWHEIVARLGAARELRALFARPAVQGGAFAPRSAAGIASAEAREPRINLAALSAGKWADATTAAAAIRADHGDRDK
jgi:hypothetical protein